MKPINVDALRRAIEGSHSSAAQDLVQRTLAQHGLASGPTGLPGPTMDLSGFTLPSMGQFAMPGAVSAKARDLPSGATFETDRYTCEAGSREYLTYVPASAAEGSATGLIMMLHGCTQNGADFANGTDMNRLAEDHNLIIVYPQQSRGDNAQSCWNWFSRGDQRHGRGEPSILAGIARQVASQHGIGQGRIFVAGLSAGGAMAVILGQTYPDVFAAVGVHSGLPHGAASDVASAFAAMSGGAAEPAKDSDQLTPTIIFHGTADHTVNPINAERISTGVLSAAPDLTMSRTEKGTSNGRTFSREIVTDADNAGLLESWKIEGLGHAWSGGHASGSYTDQKGPDASAEMIRFFLSRIS